jgi:hypothetical protein
LNIDPALIKEAKEWLDQLDEDLQAELTPDYMGSGEDYLHRMEWEIRKYHGELLDAIKAALGCWLRGSDKGKFITAAEMIDRLKATEYLLEVEKIRDQIQSGTSHWPASYLSLVEVVRKHLRDAEAQQKGQKP